MNHATDWSDSNDICQQQTSHWLKSAWRFSKIKNWEKGKIDRYKVGNPWLSFQLEFCWKHFNQTFYRDHGICKNQDFIQLYCSLLISHRGTIIKQYYCIASIIDMLRRISLRIPSTVSSNKIGKVCYSFILHFSVWFNQFKGFLKGALSRFQFTFRQSIS